MSLGKKRSGFQITSVTTDYLPSSPLSPVSPMTPGARSPSPTPPFNGPCSPPTSRFRLVRLDQAPLRGGRRYQRGRWSCVDFYQLDVASQHRAGAGHSLDSGLPRAIPPNLSPLLLSPGAGTKGQQAPRSQGTPIITGATEKETTQLSPPPRLVSPVITVQSEDRLGRPVSDVFNERLLLAQSVFRIGSESGQDSSSNNSMGAIDNKIEQAMDLVKTHLLFAVREEVEALKEQIRDLADRNGVLEHENSLLRSLATPQQLSELSARIQASKKAS